MKKNTFSSKSNITLKKFDFQWKNISPTQIGNNITTVDLYGKMLICGSSNGVAVKSVDSGNNPWRIITKTTDGIAINNIKSVKMLNNGVSLFTSGNGYFIDDGSNTVKKTAENSTLPSNSINSMAEFSSRDGHLDNILACTDKGLYNGFVGDDNPEDNSVITTADGLPSNNILSFAANNSYCIYVTDKGLAIGKSSLLIQGPATKISDISFIKDNEFLFVATEFDFRTNEKTAFIVASANKVAVSFDNGTNWENMTPPTLDNRTITCVAVDDNTLYVGTNDGLFISHKNKEIWFHYTIADGLLGNQITDIAIDVADGQFLIVSTTNGLNQGYFFNWSIATIPEVTQIFSIAKVVDGLQTQGVFFAGTDKGLYKSQDDCLTWVNVYDKAPVLCLASSPFHNGALYVGTDGDGVFIYMRVGAISKNTTPDYRYTTANGLVDNRVMCIAPLIENAFTQTVIVGYYDSPEISYINNFEQNWQSFNIGTNDLPLGVANSVKILNKKLYICSNDYENQGGFLAVSQQALSTGFDCKNMTFTVPFQQQEVAVVQDVDVINNQVFMTSITYKGGGFAGVDLRYALETDLSTWHILESNAFYGDGLMATDNGVLYINELYSLVCYNPSSDEQKAYAKQASSFLQPRPLIKNNKIYLLVGNQIYYADISAFY
ncbi:hypothetical protein [Escherichia coli]|uniref:hypothetical protein n=1 Tax=Escherichia coli TaxID=562 RepID=UPI000BE20BED|nr:hypothetical protein [Escherichia coli]MBN6133777.1 hypothetical protein [Escherichia coli]